MLGDQRLMTPYTDEERAWIVGHWLTRNPVGRVMEHPDGYAVVQYHAGPRKLHHLTAGRSWVS